MSLRGRKFFDVLQHHPSSPLNSSRFRLPCPPYHAHDYWDRVYEGMGPEDAHEWGGFDLGELLRFRHERVLRHGDGDDTRGGEGEPEPGEARSSTFAECMGVGQSSSPEEAIVRYKEHRSDGDEESVLLLGCGNSRMGEQILKNSFAGPVLQIDVSPKVIRLMRQRYERYMTESSVKRMELVVDDARGLTSLEPDSVGGGVLDKGLIDVLHCSSGAMPDDEKISRYSHSTRWPDREESGNPIRKIVDGVHRVLRPSRPFVFFSRSGPEYILRRAFDTVHWDDGISRKWSEVDVLRLVDLDVLLYRFLKAEEPEEPEERRPQIRITKRGPKKRGSKKLRKR